MDECNKRDSPSGSNTDSLIEKFRFEITKKSDEDLLNIKKLTIQASNKSRESSTSNRDIDKKISDLECLIMRLQEELNDLSSANKQKDECKQEDECEIDYCCPVVNTCEEPAPCSEEPSVSCEDNNIDETFDIEEDNVCNKTNDSMSDNENVTRPSSNRYPIILRDVGLIQESEEFDVDVKEPPFNETILINNDPAAEDNEEEDTRSIRQKIFYDWKKSEVKDEEIKEENKLNNAETITNMIAELRAEIDETIHNLNEEPK